MLPGFPPAEPRSSLSGTAQGRCSRGWSITDLSVGSSDPVSRSQASAQSGRGSAFAAKRTFGGVAANDGFWSKAASDSHLFGEPLANSGETADALGTRPKVEAEWVVAVRRSYRPTKPGGSPDASGRQDHRGTLVDGTMV